MYAPTFTTPAVPLDPSPIIHRCMIAGLFLRSIPAVADSILPDFAGQYTGGHEYSRAYFNDQATFFKFCDRVTNKLVADLWDFPFNNASARSWVREALENRFASPSAYSYFASCFWDPLTSHEWIETVYSLKPDPIVQLFQQFSSHHPIIGPMAAWIYDAVQDPDSRFSQAFRWKDTSNRSARGWYLDVIDSIATTDTHVQHGLRALISRTHDRECEGRALLHGLLSQLNQFSCELVNMANTIVVRLSYSDFHDLIYWPQFPRPKLGSWSETTEKLMAVTPYLIPDRVPEEVNSKAMGKRTIPLAVPINAVDLYHFVKYYEEYWRRLSNNLSVPGNRTSRSLWSVILSQGNDAGFDAYIKPEADAKGEARFSLRYRGEGYEDFILRVDLAQDRIATFDFAGISPEKAFRYAAARKSHAQNGSSVSEKMWSDISDSDGSLASRWMQRNIQLSDVSPGEKASLMATAIAHAGKHMITRGNFVSYHWDELMGQLLPAERFSPALRQLSAIMKRRI